MSGQKHIPDVIVSRLPLYLRSLQQLAQQNRQVTSSQELSERLGFSAAQIRKDLSQFGEFGKQGTGYSITDLSRCLKKILHVDRVWEMVVVGAGDVGHAVARYNGFADRGFHVAMLFDNDPAKIGMQVGDYIVQDSATMEDVVRDACLRVAMIAVPEAYAQVVAEQLVRAGVKAILNYAPVSIYTPSDVQVQYIDPGVHLQKMAYYLL